jgi:hypothetical protein
MSTCNCQLVSCKRMRIATVDVVVWFSKLVYPSREPVPSEAFNNTPKRTCGSGGA